MRDRGGTASWMGWQDFLPDAESADRRRDNHGSASGTTHHTHDAINKQSTPDRRSYTLTNAMEAKYFLADGESTSRLWEV